MHFFAGLVNDINNIVGIIMPCINRGKADNIVDYHFIWLIRTFWVGLLYALISFILIFFLIGCILMFAVAIWFIVCCVMGLQAIDRGETINSPESWPI